MCGKYPKGQFGSVNALYYNFKDIPKMTSRNISFKIKTLDKMCCKKYCQNTI